jgi:hypothetical protein
MLCRKGGNSVSQRTVVAPRQKLTARPNHKGIISVILARRKQKVIVALSASVKGVTVFAYSSAALRHGKALAAFWTNKQHNKNKRL